MQYETKQKLIELYVRTDIPSDRLVQHKEALDKFTTKFNGLQTEKRFTTDEIAVTLIRLRKQGELPKIRFGKRGPHVDGQIQMFY